MVAQRIVLVHMHKAHLSRVVPLLLAAVRGQDLSTNVAELCEQGRGEAALELVRTDLRNISQPLCTDIMVAFAEAGRSDCAQAALLHMQTLCVETGGNLDANTFNALMYESQCKYLECPHA